ncbi:MAG: M48 family metallopeptidase [Candidatus Pacearchaeota archaeon]|nr:M48 family metallopeptidase [Candidatus Pacearchaeota archaeon]
MDRISFYDQISSNKRKSIFLMIVVAVVLVVLGYAISFAFSPDYFFTIMILAIIISIVYVWFGYYNSASIAIASVGAKLASRDEYRQYWNSVEGLCLASGMPMPKLYVMPGKQINAFASGRNPQNSVICVTEGALEQLNKQELEGVLGHELSHIASFDIRFMTLTAVLVGMIAIISEIFLRSMWFKGGGGNDRESRGNAIFMIIGLVLAILAPIVVQLVQLAISRKREYAADASSVKFTRYPKGLISALRKIKNDSSNLKVSKAVAPLFIASPFKLSNLLATHPPLESRIKILEKM